MNLQALVSIEYLKENINKKDVIVLNALLDKVSQPLSPSKYQLKGAINFDLKNVFLNTESELPNTVPSLDNFQKSISNLGIKNSDLIIIYDEHGVYSSPRAWFLFKLMGHEKVYVLNGGFPAIQKSNLELELKTSVLESSLLKSNFKVCFQSDWLMKLSDLKNEYMEKSNLIIDARSSDRFLGIKKEPRKAMRSGSIPKSKNIPYESVLENNFIRDHEELKSIFKPLEIKNEKLIFSCGSGITACIIALAAFEIKHENISIYDGSWSEWGALEYLPIN